MELLKKNRIWAISCFLLGIQSVFSQDYQYVDFNHGQNDHVNTEWIQRIQLIEPACRSDVKGKVNVTIKAPGMIQAKAFCWSAPTRKNPSSWGHRVDLTPKGISFKADGTGTFVFSGR